MTASVARNPWTRSKSSPGVRIVTASGEPPSRISSGSSAATVSGRVLCASPRMRSTGVRLVTRPTRTTVPTPAGLTVQVMNPPVPVPAYAAVVLAGGRAARLGGPAKPQPGGGGARGGGGGGGGGAGGSRGGGGGARGWGPGGRPGAPPPAPGVVAGPP